MKVYCIEGKGFSGNIFLIDADKPCLVDAGWESDISYCAEALEKILGDRMLEKIVLTHRHIDHVGGAWSFHSRFGGDILAHSADADSLISGDQKSTGASMFGGELAPLPVKKLDHGDRIDLGSGESLEVIHTPGHTVGSICLLGHGSLLSGDTVFADGGVGRWDLDTGDYHELLGSVEKLAGMELHNLYPGHGPCVEDVAREHVAMSLRHLRLMGRFG